ncbi:MAG: hypothetical protein KGQ28_06615 [Hyphomicrobiales bacterium]|nr:hypothetical protein [Hyphomicrobiales bacterium]
MSQVGPVPGDVARRIAARRTARVAEASPWRRQSFTLPRTEAREAAKDWFQRYPKEAYMTEIEFWRELDDGRIEFTIRRRPTAD